MTSYQISLFFVNGTIYNIDKVSNELLEKNVLLKNPLLIPQQVNAPKEVNFPVIIFDKNQEFRIMANFFTMTINVIKSEKYNIMDIMNRIYDVLEENNIKAYRIGFVYKSEIENAKIEDFKKQKILSEEIIVSKCFEMSWLKDIRINNVDVNCWQRYFNIEGKTSLNTLFDINTKEQDNNNVDRIFMQEFIKDSENYVKENIFK